MAQRKVSIGRQSAKVQTADGPKLQQWVTVAVLPDSVVNGQTPAFTQGGVSINGWENAYRQSGGRQNSQASTRKPSMNPIAEEQSTSRRKSIFEKAGFKPKKQLLSDPDRPPFVMRTVPFDTWRKHYAKDKDGNYHGTSTPAADCLLKPADVEKWRLGPVTTAADKWTRGSEALPAYHDVQVDGAVPEYEFDYNEGSLEPVVTWDDDRVADQLDREDSRVQRN